MRSPYLLSGLLWFVVLSPCSAAKDLKQQTTTIEVRRFTVKEGVNFPKEFPDFLYALLIEKLNGAQLAAEVLGENELPDLQNGEFLVLEGTMLGARGAWYKGAGERKLTAEMILRHATDGAVLKKEISAGPNIWTRVSYEDENELWSAAALADRIVKEIRAALRH